MSKKYRNLIDKITSDENMRLAYYKTAKGRRYTNGALSFKEYAEINLNILANDLYNGTYEIGTPNNFYVYEPKPRLITALPFIDRTAQHALCNIIGPIFEKTFLPRSYACRVNKGAHIGVIELQSEMRRLSRNGQVYFLKTDFSRYFPSINRSVLHEFIRKKITCEATMKIIETMVPPEGTGLPIGSLTSQLFANVYGGILDRYLHQELKVTTWYRYMDDIVVLGHSQKYLREIKRKIEEFSFKRLYLKFSKWSIASINRGINFLGYRIWSTHKLLRKQSVTRAKRKIKKMREQGRFDDLAKFVASWVGHARWADSYNLLCYLELEKEKIS